MITLNRDYYYDDLVEDARILTKRYQGILVSEVLGYSHDGREIWMLKVGCGKKNIICLGGVHGRESINPIVLMKMIETYCERYDGNDKIQGNQNDWKDFLQLYSFYFIPLLNPDGYMIALRGFQVIKDDRLRLEGERAGIAHETWKYNARGIDLNRNFPSVHWVSKNQFDHAASENETKILMKVFQKINAIGFIDYHSRGKLIYYYRNQMTQAYNEIQKKIALNIGNMTGYDLAEPSEEIEIGDSGGNTVHYYCENYLRPAITIETTPDEATFPLDISFQGETYEEIWRTPFGLLIEHEQ